MNKTGTRSLARAFEMLGLRALHDSRRAKEALERAAAQGLPLLTWIDDYDCYTDSPFYSWYRQLDEQYPDSRFILNTRDDASWVISRVEHDRRRNARRKAAGDLPRPCDPIRLLALKRRKEADIRAYFAARPTSFLIFDISAGHGWPELCDFLSLPVPLKSGGGEEPFPFLGRRQRPPA